MGKKGSVPIKGFSLLHIALLHSDTKVGPNNSPVWGKNGFATYDAVEAIFHAIKWFLMTVFHSQWYKHTVVFNGICYLEELCEARNFRTAWCDDDFNTRAASYRLVLVIHDILGIAAALANHLPAESIIPAFYTFEDDSELFPCQLVPSTLEESGWLSPLQADLDRCGRNSSCFSASLDPAPVIDHPLFESINHRSTSSSSFNVPLRHSTRKRGTSNNEEQPATVKKDKVVEKPQKAPPNMAILKVVEGKVASEVLREASTQKSKFQWQL
jgi:hypothetical protein